MKTHNITILGLQWGDEGKGKVVDYFAGMVDIIARFCGGANAGHTVINNQGKFILHLLPSGILHPDKLCFMGGGMVCDPAGLFEELDGIKARGVSCEGRLFIDYSTHLVLPQHKAIEKRAEEINQASSIATTLRGIGPAYADKADRIGIMAGDLIDEPRLMARVKNFMAKKQPELAGLENDGLNDPGRLFDFLNSFADRFRTILTDVAIELKTAIGEGKRALFEGAQGSLLDIALGTYPFVTSSNTSIGGLFTGLGLPPGAEGEVLGVVKAYTTRVGNGPFPTELKDAVGEKLRDRGGEYGATTGRPRRTGWLDLAIVRRTAFMSGVSGLVLTKLDVLDELDEIRVCIGHRYENRQYDFPPLFSGFMEKVEPIYGTLPGWQKATDGITDFADLPKKARDYVKFIELQTGVPVRYVSTGSEREAIIKIS